MDDKEITDAFIEHLQKKGYQGLTIVRRDEERSPDVEAVTEEFAIEHTSIDTIVNQRRDSDWFMQAVGSLEKELSHNLRYLLRITIPYEGVQQRYDFSSIKEGLRSWILNNSAKLSDGAHTIRDVTEIPFEFHVIKTSERRSGLFFSRSSPDDPSLPNRLKKLINRKVQKLAPYKKGGKTTMLLIEYYDQFLMNESEMREAIRSAFGNSLPEGIDEIWYVDTSITTDLQFSNYLTTRRHE
jgi:hypothetical protein